MKNIKQILNSILKDVRDNSDNVKILDDEHVLDLISGVTFHIYDDYFYITKDEKRVTESNFTRDSKSAKGERDIIRQIKELIMSPEKLEYMTNNYDKQLLEGRELFSSWYENPEPVEHRSEAVEEEDAEDYVRE